VDFYLPDLCVPTRVLGTILTTELVALLVTIARLGNAGGFWGDFARNSLLLIWIALPAAGLLCVLRPLCARLAVPAATALAMSSLLAITLLVSEVAWWGARLIAGPLSSLPPIGNSHAGFTLGNCVFVLIAGGMLLRYFFISDQRRRHLESSARARVDALQARIRPHFLYNSMNTIAALTRSDPVAAERAIEDLADLFRASLAETRALVRFSEELEVARTYERIERLRLRERLHVDWRVDPAAADAWVPCMFLQPLLENAIHHGIENLPAGGTVTITAQRTDAGTNIVVENPVAADAATRPGHGIALDNLRERLALMYEGGAQLHAEAGTGRFVVRLHVPPIDPQAFA
jgi:two-component system sensor histidine kinase AlgZ